MAGTVTSDTGARRESREVLPDVLRGFAVLLVALGHAIQVGNGAEYRLGALYFEDPLYWFIYSFHMPLFMLISGCFSYHAVTRGTLGRSSAVREIGARASKLILPVFLWSVLDYLRSCAEILAGGHDRLQILALAEYFPVSFCTNLWFLWSVFFNFLLVLIVEAAAKRFTGQAVRLLLYAVIFLLMFVTPDGMNLGAYKFMFPYFLIGYTAAKRSAKTDPAGGNAFAPNCRHEIPGTLAAGLLFAGLFLFYRADSLIYVSGYKLIARGGTAGVISQLGVDLYRLAVGLSGSLFFCMLFRLLLCTAETSERMPFLIRAAAYLGQESMGIYILSGYIQTLCFVTVTDRIAEKSGSVGPNYLLCVLNMAAAVGVSVVLIRLISRVKVLRKLIGK